MEWSEKYVDAVVDNAVGATQSARKGFLVINIACLITLLGLWNQQLSWSAWTEQDRLRAGITKCNEAETPDAARKAKCAELTTAFDTVTRLNWDDYNSISVPVVGVRLDTDDVPLLGSVGVFIFVTWWWWTLRRQNHATRDALRLVAEGSGELDRDRYVRQKVGGAFVLLTPTKDDQPEWAVSEIAQRDREAESALSRALHRSLSIPHGSSPTTPGAGPRSRRGGAVAIAMRFAVVGLQLLPVVTVLVAVGLEIWTCTQKSWIVEGLSFWADLSRAGHAEAMLARLGGAFIALIAVAASLWGCLRWTRSTILMVAQIDLLVEKREGGPGDTLKAVA
jgi:hypothetical protein